MTISNLKQKKIITLAQQGLSIPEIAKETSTSYKTAKKYAGMITTPQPQLPAPQQPVIGGRSPKFAPPKSKRGSDTTRSYAVYENVPYYRPVSVDPPLGRGLVNVTDAKPLVPAKPLTKMQKEQEKFKNRKGIDVSWVQKENAERRLKNERIQRENIEEMRKKEHNEKMARHIDELQQIVAQKNQDRNREIIEHPVEQGFSRDGIQGAIREIVQVDKEKMHMTVMAFSSLKELQNNELYRIKKKKMDEKFLAGITPSALGFLDDIVKSVIMFSSKPKIVKAQLVKKPMKAIVIK